MSVRASTAAIVYVDIARERISSLARGELPMRAMGTPLLDPRDAGAVGRRPAAWDAAERVPSLFDPRSPS